MSDHYQLVKLRKYKLAHWDPRDRLLHSEMFSNLDEAKSKGYRLEQDGFQYVLMENTYAGDGTYGWIPLLVGGLPMLAMGGAGAYGLYKVGGVMYDLWQLKWVFLALGVLWVFRPKGGRKDDD